MIQIPLTPHQFAAVAQKVQQEQGITLTGNEGKLSKMGVTAAYHYAEGILKVTILDKPFFVTTDYCETELRKFLDVKA